MVERDLAGEAVTFEGVRSICRFLYYGYVTGDRMELPVCVEPPNHDGRPAVHCMLLKELVCEGVSRLSAVYRALLDSHANASMHVIPISGGMDSRAILGGLLPYVDSSRMQAVTFGVPGTWDFDIGRMVAKEAGVAHTQIDLSDVPWDTESLVRFAGECEHPIALFEPYLFHQMRVRFGHESVYWSGFMGDPLAGSHLCKQDSTSWSQAMSCFVARGRCCRSTELTPPGFSALDSLPQVPLADPSILCYDEQLDFAVRQGCYIKAIVVPRGYVCYAPFLHPDWVSFVLSVRRRYRQGQHLYKEILKTAYPKLFSLPTKNSFGLPLSAPRWRRCLRRQGLRLRAAARRSFPWVDWRTSPNTNYIDFDRGLRERADLKTVVYESIQDLKKRRIVDWINIDAIWNRHQNRQANHADALTLLASLEINLKARELRPT